MNQLNPLKNRIQKWFIFNGFLLLFIAMIFPFYSPWAHTQEGILKVHLIGTLEAILLFAFAWFWMYLEIPKQANRLAIVLIYIAFWSNVVGSAIIAILGVNILVHFFLSCSEYIIISILIALCSFCPKIHSMMNSKGFVRSMLGLTVLFTAFIIWQAFSH